MLILRWESLRLNIRRNCNATEAVSKVHIQQDFFCFNGTTCEVFLKVSRKISLDLSLKISSIRKVMLPVPRVF